MLPPAPAPPIEPPPAVPPPPPKNVRGREVGLLVAVVDRARNLLSSGASSEQDAFVEVGLTGSPDPSMRTKSTKVDERDGQVPVWDEEFRFRLFEVDGTARQSLVLSVNRQERDDDVEIVGEARIMVDGSWDHFDQWVDLKKDGKYKGEIYVELTFYHPDPPAQRPSNEYQRRPSEESTLQCLPITPALGHRVSAVNLNAPVPTLLPQSLPAADGTARRQSEQHPAPLPFPGDPDSPELPQALRPGGPSAARAPPFPAQAQHSPSYAAGHSPVRLPSPGAQLAGHAHVQYTGLPAPALAPAQYAQRHLSPHSPPGVAVSQALATPAYPSSAIPYAPAVVPSTTPIPPPPAPHSPVQALPQSQNARTPSGTSPSYAWALPHGTLSPHMSTTIPFASSSTPLAPRSPSPGLARPPIPPRPSSSSSMTHMPGALPASPPIVTPASPAPSMGSPPVPLASMRRTSLSPHTTPPAPPPRTASSPSRSLPPNPVGDVRPPPTPRKADEAAAAAEQARYEHPPPLYAAGVSGSLNAATAGAPGREEDAYRIRHAAERLEGERRARIVEERRAHMEGERQRADEDALRLRREEQEEARRRAELADLERRRQAEDARQHAAKADLERRRRGEEAERQRAQRAAAEQRAAQIERERLDQVAAAQRALAARIKQEQDDARIAAQLAADAEQAERRREEDRRAADEEAVRRLLEQEQAAEARAQRELERQDAEFVLKFREEERRREAEERRAREAADEALALRLREEEDAERQRRMAEDERIARSLAEQDHDRSSSATTAA
ncbi:hypothetical protein JCM3770_000282 [Rhodotorula araucariae]